MGLSNVKTAVFYLDGGMFNLNALRYHYYALLCHSYQLEASQKEFYTHLEKDEQEKDPETLALEAKIEDYVQEYCQTKRTPLVLGIKEFLKYLKMQQIHVVIYTYLPKEEVTLLLMKAGLWDDLYTIYSQEDGVEKEPLKSFDLLSSLYEADEVLMITGKEYVAKKAVDQQYHVILVKDQLQDPTYATYYVDHTLDLAGIIAKMIVDKYDPLDLFSPLLGFSDQMDLDELDQRFIVLRERFKNDSRLLSLVNQAYLHYYRLAKDQLPTRPQTVSLEDSVAFEPEPVEESTSVAPAIEKNTPWHWKDMGYEIFNSVFYGVAGIFFMLVLALGIYPYLKQHFSWIIFIEKIYAVYHHVAYVFVGLFYQCFAAIFPIPDFQTWLLGNSWISEFGLHLILDLILWMILYLLVRMIYVYIEVKKAKEKIS